MSVLDFAGLAPKEQLAVDVGLFKDSMRQLASAVSVITAGRGEDRTGFTATSVFFAIDRATIGIGEPKPQFVVLAGIAAPRHLRCQCAGT